MLISDVLRRKGDFVATVAPDATIRQLLSALAEHNVGALVVSADGVSVAGIVSERDVVRSLQRGGAELLTQPVSSIMTPQVKVAAPDESVERLQELMTKQRIRHVPVVSEGRLTGIVSIGDVVASRMEQMTSERDSLIGYISSAQ